MAVFRDQFGEPEDVLVLSEVSDEVLRDLYVAADFVFQPSLYEGFGYPVAEAMHCGAAVIATRTASIPEITGEAALLIDPSDVEAGAAAIERLATDPEDPRASAPGRAAAGRPIRRARTARPSDARLLARCGRASVDTPTHCSLQFDASADCGIADYTAELADALAETHEVDVYTDGSYMPTARASPRINFRHVRDFDAGEPGLRDRIFQLQARDYQ